MQNAKPAQWRCLIIRFSMRLRARVLRQQRTSGRVCSRHVLEEAHEAAVRLSKSCRRHQGGPHPRWQLPAQAPTAAMVSPGSQVARSRRRSRYELISMHAAAAEAPVSLIVAMLQMGRSQRFRQPGRYLTTGQKAALAQHAYARRHGWRRWHPHGPLLPPPPAGEYRASASRMAA